MTTPLRAHQALKPSDDPAWVLDQYGFDPLRDSSRESRFAISNGFLGVRGARTIDRLPDTATAPRTYVAGLFDTVATDRPISALVTCAGLAQDRRVTVVPELGLYDR